MADNRQADRAFNLAPFLPWAPPALGCEETERAAPRSLAGANPGSGKAARPCLPSSPPAGDSYSMQCCTSTDLGPDCAAAPDVSRAVRVIDIVPACVTGPIEPV